MEALLEVDKYKCITTQADAVLYFIQSLDVDMLDELLSPERTYQDFPKQKFIEKVGVAFEEFKQMGDTHLNRYPGFCNSNLCSRGCKGYRLIGNVSGRYMNLLYKVKDGEVEDMYECSDFKCLSNLAVDKKDRIYIDPFELPF
jgi:hypothetical protein